MKWTLCGVVLLFVALRARALWSQDELQDVALSPGWLIAAAAAYLAGWLPAAWYWRRLMRALGNDVGLLDTARAYFCGHLGKYIPGKAGVLLIRAGMLKERGHSAAVAATTAAVETLLLMGAGLALGLALFPLTNWPPAIADRIPHPALMPVLVAVAVGLALTAIAMLLRKFAAIMTPRTLSGERRVVGIDSKLVAVGLCAFCLSWSLHGLSLGFTLRAVAPESASLADWPVWIGAAAISTALGFLAIFAPGGLGVREGLLIEILSVQPGVGARNAVVAAVLLRLVWFIAEVLAAGGLFYAGRGRAPGPFVERAPPTGS